MCQAIVKLSKGLKYRDSSSACKKQRRQTCKPIVIYDVMNWMGKECSWALARYGGQNGQRDLGNIHIWGGQNHCQGGLKSLPFACLFVLTSLAVSLEEAGVGGRKNQLRALVMDLQELSCIHSLEFYCKSWFGATIAFWLTIIAWYLLDPLFECLRHRMI